MSEPLPLPDALDAPTVDETSSNGENSARRKTVYLPYRPPGSEFSDYTPPASPQPSSLQGVPRKGFGSSRSNHPADLQTDIPPPPAYERPTYSPSPSSSPPLPPALPSPHFLPRQRAPSLLRRTATSSPLNDGYPRAEQPLGSPTFSPLMRPTTGTGPTSDPRTIFNPLASNPVSNSEPSGELSQGEVSGGHQSRSRGLTSSSQPGFTPQPPLRSATSIPDYGQYRGNERSNPSSAYRPNRGGENWSHKDYFPPRPFRPEESRASFRSAWTNASSSFVDASGTERSSMATGRSSISDNRTSVYSVDRQADRNDSSDAAQDSPEQAPVEDDIMSVEDVIDSYCYGIDDRMSGMDLYEDRVRLSSSPVGASDSEVPALSQTYSQSDHGSSPLPREPSLQHNRHQETDEHHPEVRDNDYDTREQHADDDFTQRELKRLSPRGDFLPPLQLSPLNLEYSPTVMSRPEDHPSTDVAKAQSPTAPASPPRPFSVIHKDLQALPALPQTKSRLSRQDWADIQAYARKNSRLSDDATRDSISKRPPLAVYNSPPKTSPLPEVDEDEAYPRRASTSVFDRRSNLFEFNKALPSSKSPPTQWRTPEYGNEVKSTGRRQSDNSFNDLPPTSPPLPGYSLPRTNTGLTLSRTATARDQYGFKKATINVSVQQHDAWYNTYEQYVSRRRAKWVALMEKSSLFTTNPNRFPERSEKVRRYARKGYPPEWRGAMWWYYSNGERKLQEMTGVYPSLLARVRQGALNKDDGEAIERDLDRTFPDNIHFRPDPTPENPEGKFKEEPKIIRDLREVLQCFALNNPNIGYCQSLNFIAGLLLLFMKQDNERVFILLTIITQQHLPGAHARSLANTEVNVLMMLIKDYLPKVWASINDTDLVNNGLGSHAHPGAKFQRQPTVALSCTSWFMSLFVGVLPIEVVLRVWDAFLYEGPRALFRYALGIFKLGEPEIRKFHPGDGELFMTVQNLPRKCLDPNVLHDIAFVKKGFGSLTQGIIDQKRLFWQQQLAREPSTKRLPAVPPKPGMLAVESEVTEEKKGISGLRRKASRRFFKKDKV